MNKLSKRVLSLLLALLMVLGTCDQALAAGLDNGRYENDNTLLYIYDSTDSVIGVIQGDMHVVFVFEDKGKVLVIVCPLFYDEGCILSSLIARDCGYKSISLIREAKALIKMLLLDCDFIEISTQVGWRNAERLARVLGFEPDRLEKNFYNGIDFNIWRINR